MSLVNDMLQDLQHRQAPNSQPLAGLHAVDARPGPVAADQRHWRLAPLVLVLTIAVIALWWRPVADSYFSPAPLSKEFTELPATLPADEGAPVDIPGPMSEAEIPVFANLGAYRMDYRLQSPPQPRPQSKPQLTPQQKPPLSRKTISQPPARPKVAAVGVETPPQDQPAQAVITRVAPIVRYRRDGLAALRAGQAATAEKQFYQLVRANPKSHESYLLLHAALQAQSRTTEAQKVLRDGLKQSADTAQLAQVLAHALLEEDRVDGALNVLTGHRPATMDPDYEARLAAVNQRAGQHAVAAKLYERLLSDQPDNGAWWVGLAISQEAQGDPVAAAGSYASATASGTLNIALARYAADRLQSLETGS